MRRGQGAAPSYIRAQPKLYHMFRFRSRRERPLSDRDIYARPLVLPLLMGPQASPNLNPKFAEQVLDKGEVYIEREGEEPVLFAAVGRAGEETIAEQRERYIGRGRGEFFTVLEYGRDGKTMLPRIWRAGEALTRGRLDSDLAPEFARYVAQRASASIQTAEGGYTPDESLLFTLSEDNEGFRYITGQKLTTYKSPPALTTQGPQVKYTLKGECLGDVGVAEFLRDRLVNFLIARGVTDQEVIRAMRKVPRHLFVPGEHLPRSYDDDTLHIGGGQTISQPYIVGYMTQALKVGKGSKVLEVGCGSGYQTAILAELAQGGFVHTVEVRGEFVQPARQRLSTLGYRNVEVVEGDGSVGLPEHAPFDRIMVTASAPRIPDTLKRQLADGGRMIIPVRASMGESDLDVLMQVDRKGDEYAETRLIPCRFVRLTGKEG